MAMEGDSFKFDCPPAVKERVILPAPHPSPLTLWCVKVILLAEEIRIGDHHAELARQEEAAVEARRLQADHDFEQFISTPTLILLYWPLDLLTLIVMGG